MNAFFIKITPINVIAARSFMLTSFTSIKVTKGTLNDSSSMSPFFLPVTETNIILHVNIVCSVKKKC